MSNWGRKESYNWPSDKPVWTRTAFFASIALFFLELCLNYLTWTPLQRYWLPTYLSASMSHFGATDSKYRLLLVQHADGKDYLPSDDDVEPGLTRTPDGRRIPFVLTDSAREAGRQLFLTPPKLWNNAYVSEKLRDEVYGSLTLTG